MASVMVFHGGPKDGQREEPREGFPAPDGGAWPHRGDMHQYDRADTWRDDATGDVVHVYRYRGIR